MKQPPPLSTLFPYTTLFRSIYHSHDENALPACYFVARLRRKPLIFDAHELPLENNPNFTRWHRLTALAKRLLATALPYCSGDRKSTRLNSSHPSISYAVFCL